MHSALKEISRAMLKNVLKSAFVPNHADDELAFCRTSPRTVPCFYLAGKSGIEHKLVCES